MTADSIMVSNNTIDAVGASLANELAGTAADMPTVELRHYRYKKVCMSVEQIANPKFPLCDIQRRHVKDQIASTRALGFDYRNEMVTVTWSEVCDPADLTVEDETKEKDCLKDCKRMFQDSVIRRASLL